jgi:hypothetical protein
MQLNRAEVMSVINDLYSIKLNQSKNLNSQNEYQSQTINPFEVKYEKRYRKPLPQDENNNIIRPVGWVTALPNAKKTKKN